MSVYVDLENARYPVLLEEVRRILNKVSLPKHPTEEQLKKYGFCLVHPTAKPQGRRVVERYPRYLEGKFFQAWEVVESDDIDEWKHDLIQRVKREYHGQLERGWTSPHGVVDITKADELSMVFLECLFLGDEDSKETVEFLTPEDDAFGIGVEEGMALVKSITKHRRRLKQHYTTQLTSIKDCVSVEECKEIKRKFDTDGVFPC